MYGVNLTFNPTRIPLLASLNLNLYESQVQLTIISFLDKLGFGLYPCWISSSVKPSLVPTFKNLICTEYPPAQGRDDLTYI